MSAADAPPGVNERERARIGREADDPFCSCGHYESSHDHDARKCGADVPNGCPCGGFKKSAA